MQDKSKHDVGYIIDATDRVMAFARQARDFRRANGREAAVQAGLLADLFDLMTALSGEDPRDNPDPIAVKYISEYVLGSDEMDDILAGIAAVSR